MRDGEFWPTLQQELLLQASLYEGESSLQAWHSWRSQVDIEAVDGGSHRLLPMLYKNLMAQDVSHPDLARYRSVYKHSWARNRLSFHQMDEVLRLFQANGLNTLLLKGAALSLLYYRDSGARSMNDFDILVPTSQARQALQVLSNAGWETEFSTASSRILLTHSMLFKNKLGVDFDLHWHVMEECCLPESDEAFWQHAIPITHQGLETLALSPTDQIMHLLVHGLRWAEYPPIRWIADTLIVLRHAEAQIDWARLVDQTEQCSIILPVYLGLKYLAANFDAPIPEATLSRLAKASVSRRDEMEFRVKARRRTHWRRLLFHWFNYQRLKQVVDTPVPIYGFVEYLRQRLGLPTVWHLPVALRRRTILEQ